jgi:hypothetical protein
MNETPSKPRQTQAADDSFSNGAPSFQPHHAATALQVLFLRGIDQVAFAKRGPVQAVGFIKDLFMDFSLPLRSLRGAKGFFAVFSGSESPMSGRAIPEGWKKVAGGGACDTVSRNFWFDLPFYL